MSVVNITFDASPGLITGTNSSTIVIATNSDGKINVADIPESIRDGYLLNGWAEIMLSVSGFHFPTEFPIKFGQTSSSETKLIDFETRVFTQNTTIYAVWEKQPDLIVTFYLNNSIYARMTPDAQGKISTPPTAPEIANKIFVGWSYTDSSTTIIDFETAVFNKPETVWGIYGISTLITFNANNGYFEDDTSVKTVLTDINGYVTPPDIPDRGLDWEFMGWALSSNPDTVIDLSTTVFNTPTTLVAKWTKLETRVIFNPNGGYWGEDPADTDPKVIPLSTRGKPVLIPDSPKKSATEVNSFQFVGWTLNQDDETTLIPDISLFETDESVELFALWQTMYTIVLDANSGYFAIVDENGEVIETVDKISYTLEIGESILDESMPSVMKANASFEYWAYDIDGKRPIENPIDEFVSEENVTLYAIWKNVWQVIFNANGGAFANGAFEYTRVNDGECANPPSPPSKPNAKFIGWATDEDAGITDTINLAGYPIKADTTFYAVWEKVITILFHANTGAFPNGETYISREANALGYVEEPVTPVKEGFEFRGWAITANAELSDIISVDNTRFTQDTALYAVWHYIVYVTFNSNGGEYLPGTNIIIRADDSGHIKEPLNLPTRLGYIFKGWGFTSDSTEPIDLKTQIFKEQTVLYAVWKLIVYVTFDANYGAFPDGTESITIRASEEGYLNPPQDPVRNGHKFVGWGNTKDSQQSDAIDIPTTEFTQIVTIYAIWERVFVSTIEFGFYDSLRGDRRYDAKDIASIFDGIIFDGISATNNNYYQVEPAASGLRVVVKSGKAWFDHTCSINTADIILQLDTPHWGVNRYDAIVLEVNRETRINSIKVVKGPTPSGEKPNLIFTDKVKQYLLAWVRLRPRASTITWADVDNRAGLSTQLTLGLMQVVPISTFTQYWNTWRNEFYKYFNDLKKVVNQGTIDNIVQDLNLMINISDKALITTPTSNDTLYLTNYSAKIILLDGLRPTGTIIGSTNPVSGFDKNGYYAKQLNSRLYLSHKPLFLAKTNNSPWGKEGEE